jgi:hypothetical protein
MRNQEMSLSFFSSPEVISATHVRRFGSLAMCVEGLTKQEAADRCDPPPRLRIGHAAGGGDSK